MVIKLNPTLRTVAKGKDEAHDEKAKVEVVEEDVGGVDAFETKLGCSKTWNRIENAMECLCLIR